MVSIKRLILFTFLWGFYSMADTFSQDHGIEVYEYTYVTRGGKTIQESTTIYLTTASHKVHNGYKWSDGYYYIIGIISRKGKFILQTFDEDGKVKINTCDGYKIIRNVNLVKKIVICDDYAQIIFYGFIQKSTITLSKEKYYE